MDKVIVFGAAGFVGSSLFKELIKSGYDVIGIIKPGTKRTIEWNRIKNEQARILECDLREVDILINDIEQADYFFNCAWEGTDAQGICDEMKQYRNIGFHLNAIKVAENLGCREYVGVGAVSQLELLEKPGRLNVNERHKYYRAALDCVENMGRALALDIGIGFKWPIIINAYNEEPFSKRFINTFVKNVINNVPMTLSSGLQYYDFIHSSDLAKALILFGMSQCNRDSYIIGTGEKKRLREFLIEARDLLNPQYELRFSENTNSYSLTYDRISSEDFCNDFLFEPCISFEEGIRRIKAQIEGT